MQRHDIALRNTDIRAKFHSHNLEKADLSMVSDGWRHYGKEARTSRRQATNFI